MSSAGAGRATRRSSRWTTCTASAPPGTASSGRQPRLGFVGRGDAGARDRGRPEQARQRARPAAARRAAGARPRRRLRDDLPRSRRTSPAVSPLRALRLRAPRRGRRRRDDESRAPVTPAREPLPRGLRPLAPGFEGSGEIRGIVREPRDRPQGSRPARRRASPQRGSTCGLRDLHERHAQQLKRRLIAVGAQ